MSIDTDLAAAALTVAEWALMKRNEHPLFDYDAYKRALAHFEEVQTRVMVERAESLMGTHGPSVPFESV